MWVEFQKIGTKRSNLHRAMEQRWSIQIFGVFPWAFFQRKKWLDGLEKETKNKVRLWWTFETRVGPNKKDVAHKHIRPKQYEECAIHFLLESQVNW